MAGADAGGERVRLVGVGGSGRQPEHGAVDGRPAERVPGRCHRLGDALRAVGEAAHALDLDHRVATGMADADRRLAAVDGEDARHHPARFWCEAVNAAPVMSAVSWYLSPR